MSNIQTISKEYFLKKVGDLCLRSGLSGFPKNEADQHILMKSALLLIGQEVLTEQKLNERLNLWLQVTQIKGIDHAMLRRRLVDTGYLSRSADGTAYQINPNGVGDFEFEASIDQIDLAEAITAAREEIERKKRMYTQKPPQG